MGLPQHGPLPSPHPYLLVLSDDFSPHLLVFDLPLVGSEDLFEHELRARVGADQGPLQDVQVDALVLLRAVDVTQAEVNQAEPDPIPVDARGKYSAVETKPFP